MGSAGGLGGGGFLRMFLGGGGGGFFTYWLSVLTPLSSSGTTPLMR